MIDIKEIEKLAILSRLELEEEEKNGLQGDLNAILGYVEKIKKVSSKDVVSSDLSQKNITRDDDNENTSAENKEVLLSLAPESEDGRFKTKKILKMED